MDFLPPHRLGGAHKRDALYSSRHAPYVNSFPDLVSFRFLPAEAATDLSLRRRCVLREARSALDRVSSESRETKDEINEKLVIFLEPSAAKMR